MTIEKVGRGCLIGRKAIMYRKNNQINMIS